MLSSSAEAKVMAPRTKQRKKRGRIMMMSWVLASSSKQSFKRRCRRRNEHKIGTLAVLLRKVPSCTIRDMRHRGEGRRREASSSRVRDPVSAAKSSLFISEELARRFKPDENLCSQRTILAGSRVALTRARNTVSPLPFKDDDVRCELLLRFASWFERDDGHQTRTTCRL